MTYIGIDQSYSSFGITFLYGDGSSETQVKHFSPDIFGPGVTRLAAIDCWLRQTLTTSDLEETIDHICIEGYANGAKFGREKAGELGATIKTAIYEASFDDENTRYPTIVAPTSLKKFILGVGKGGKNEILLGVFKRFQMDFKDDNAADSYGLAQIAKAIDTGETQFAYEREVLKKLTPYTERPVGF